MSDREILEKILSTIANDEDLTQTFALVIGLENEELENFLDYVDIPELTRKGHHELVLKK